jgi:hypothetical protein
MTIHTPPPPPTTSCPGTTLLNTFLTEPESSANHVGLKPSIQLYEKDDGTRKKMNYYVKLSFNLAAVGFVSQAASLVERNGNVEHDGTRSRILDNPKDNHLSSNNNIKLYEPANHPYLQPLP